MSENETMKKVGELYPITPDTPEGKEIKELLEGMGLIMTGDNLMLAIQAYMLGQANAKTDVETRVDVLDEVSKARLALKKAIAIFSDVEDDCQFVKAELSETDLHFLLYYHDNISHKAYAVEDYLGEAIDILEHIAV